LYTYHIPAAVFTIPTALSNQSVVPKKSLKAANYQETAMAASLLGLSLNSVTSPFSYAQRSPLDFARHLSPKGGCAFALQHFNVACGESMDGFQDASVPLYTAGGMPKVRSINPPLFTFHHLPTHPLFITQCHHI
jgi:hypothetical protein